MAKRMMYNVYKVGNIAYYELRDTGLRFCYEHRKGRSKAWAEKCCYQGVTIGKSPYIKPHRSLPTKSYPRWQDARKAAYTAYSEAFNTSERKQRKRRSRGPRVIPQEDLCPKCQQRARGNGDYLCETCRWGQ